MVRWQGRRRSENVEDRRGAAVGMSGIALVVMRLVMSRYGFGGLAALVAGFFVLQALGLNPLALLQGGQGGGSGGRADDETIAFAEVVLGETEDVWGRLFAESGRRYEPPILSHFSGEVQSACGFASSAVGPFYCPADRRVYLDTSFFREMAQRFGAPGDFAAAYVIAHEVGHHVQMLTGVAEKVRAAQARSSQEEGNAIQVRMELQADCYAGVWARSADRMSDFIEEEKGDIEEGLKAAAAIGDDTLQRNAGRRVQPESFTHGTSEQRVEWFSRGYRSGNPDDCNTFQGP